MEPDPQTGHSGGLRSRTWDCRLCTLTNEQRNDICGYCGNPRAANHTLPPLPWRPRLPQRTQVPQPPPLPPHRRRRPRPPRVRPYVLALTRLGATEEK
ncbi:hypothetical protein LP52_10805 [Streptomonospora alba]|uniref:RanBP2-type domain-containing protein n=1 Tax=Streptomonospora alba TaxID=183763 RepID=A0A0C2JQ05_9ACTN|nr:hypothetical protein [Streptomonospora alba]KIH98907.1 hypothetical protein LP52_10805 [Streptomonospora alba]